MLCKKGLKIVNIDLGHHSLKLIYMALFERGLQQPNTVEMIRVVNFREKGNPKLSCSLHSLRLMLTRQLHTPVTVVVGTDGVYELANMIKSGLTDHFLYNFKPRGMEIHSLKKRIRFIVDANNYVHIYVSFDD